MGTKWTAEEWAGRTVTIDGKVAALRRIGERARAKQLRQIAIAEAVAAFAAKLIPPIDWLAVMGPHKCGELITDPDEGALAYYLRPDVGPLFSLRLNCGANGCRAKDAIDCVFGPPVYSEARCGDWVQRRDSGDLTLRARYPHRPDF